MDDSGTATTRTATGSARRIGPEPLTPESWAPFGWVPVPDTDPADGIERLVFERGDPHLNVIGHRRDEAAVPGSGLRCEELFRHDTHTQALMSLDAVAVVAVAPAAVGFDRPEDVGAIRVFAVEPFRPFVLYPGTWHWGPYPAGAELVTLLNLQGLGYREDNARVRLGSPVDVILDP